jgi:peptide/nickel transport system substrate-binding protein
MVYQSELVGWRWKSNTDCQGLRLLVRALPLLLCTAILVLLVACGRTNQALVASNGSNQPERGDWIVVQFPNEPGSLNPFLDTSFIRHIILDGGNGSGITESLLRYNTTDWTFTEPLLAQTYPDISQDHLRYTFAVRQGVHWHDGKPFTAEDVLFSMKALMCPFTDAAPFRGAFTELANVELLEDQKVRFTFNKSYYTNLEAAGGISILPKHIYDASGLLDHIPLVDILNPQAKTNELLRRFGQEFNRHSANRAHIGTGPYKFSKWETGKEVVLNRNADYWGEKPYLDRIVFRFITDTTAALTLLKNGEVDFVPRLDPIQYVDQTKRPAFEKSFVKTTYDIGSRVFITWNNDRPLFKDKRVRQAMSLLIDRQQIIQAVLFGLGKPAASMFPPSSPNSNPAVKSPPYDPQGAATLLDEAGWIDHDGDGVRDKDGVPFRFEMLSPSGNRTFDQLLSIFKESFRKAGIDMVERRLETALVMQTRLDRRFDATIATLTPGNLNEDPYYTLHSQAAERGQNVAGFRNPEVDRLIEQARTEFDAEKRRQLFWQLQEIVRDEQPYTYLYYIEWAAAYQGRFQNVKWLPIAPGYDINSWFVPRAAQRFATSQQ